jgi:uncharacterized protein YtpQ (UPF0354 family)
MNIEKFDEWLKVAKKDEQFIYHKGHLAVDANNSSEIKKLRMHVRDICYKWDLEKNTRKIKNIIVPVQRVVKRYTEKKIKRIDCDYIAIKV